jgi:hypothetical protein
MWRLHSVPTYHLPPTHTGVRSQEAARGDCVLSTPTPYYLPPATYPLLINDHCLLPLKSRRSREQDLRYDG